MKFKQTNKIKSNKVWTHHQKLWIRIKNSQFPGIDQFFIKFNNQFIKK